MKDIINFALIGFGIVGSGTVELFQKNKLEIEKKLGFKLNLKYIADIDIKTDRGIKLGDIKLVDDAMQIMDDLELDIIVETVGGVGIAKKIILNSIENGLHVVTANKKLLAEYGDEIFKKAEEKNVKIFFEAAIGGAIPIVRAIKNSFVSDKITEIKGILNGTTNYILEKIEKDNLSFDDALELAQEKGYAESDPSADIDGIDAGHKIALLSKISFAKNFDFKDVFIEGIANLQQQDFFFADKLGFKIKLIAIAKNGEKLQTSVYPALISKENKLANVNGVTNAVSVLADGFGEIMMEGAGAGSLPTATAVLADVIESAKVVRYGDFSVFSKNFREDLFEDSNILSMDDRVGEYYIRFSFPDISGILAKITKIFADSNISIASFLQIEKSIYGKRVNSALLLHSCKEKDFLFAKNKIDSLDFMIEKSIFFRVER